LIVPMILFIALTPGVLLTIPPINGKLFLSGTTGVTQVMVHAFVFSLTYASLRGTFPSAY
jgi:hypothetical protein